MQEKLVIVDGDGNEICCAYDEDGNVDLLIYDDTDFAIGAALDAGGVRALADWLTAWLERREAGDVDGQQPALLGDG